MDAADEPIPVDTGMAPEMGLDSSLETDPTVAPAEGIPFQETPTLAPSPSSDGPNQPQTQDRVENNTGTESAPTCELEAVDSAEKSGDTDSESSLEVLYHSKKSELVDLIKLNSSHYFDAKSDPGAAVGLLNQGATCYLNCLLQALYSDVDFCSSLFRSHSTNLIIEELRLLFATICLSEHATVTTKALTKVSANCIYTIFEFLHRFWS